MGDKAGDRRWVGHQQGIQLIELCRGGRSEEARVPPGEHFQACAIHKNQTANALGMFDGYSLDDPAAHGPAAQVGLLEPDCVEEIHHQICLIGDGVGRVDRFFGLAEAKKVRCVDAEAGAVEEGGKIGPIFRAATETVYQNDWSSIGWATHIVVDTMPVNHDFAALDAGKLEP